jgi:thiosulfate/3-mercaptopyruvate sulfurtransferase
MVVAVAIAALMGGPGAAPGAAAPSFFEDIETGADHIDAATLARELMAAPGELAVVDLRPAEEFAAWHLPFARNLTVPEVTGARGREVFAAAPRRVVLCSNGAAHPAQAWVELRRQGHANVAVLDGGLDVFKAEILTPPSLRGPTSEATSKAEAPLFALRRAFFLGTGKPSPLQTWATDPGELQKPTMVSTRWLADRLQSRPGAIAVVDARESPADYAAMHIPGAVHLPVATLRQKHGDRELLLLPAEQLAARFAALGIARTTPVVVYAEDKLHDATLAAMAFLRCGHEALAILEGGLLRWAADRRPLTNVVPAPAAAVYEPRSGADTFTVDANAVHAAMQAGNTTLLDVRPSDFFRGEKSTEARPGHIPGAVNRVYSKDLVRTDDGHWIRPRGELEQEYERIGVQRDKPTIVSCRTGHTASESWFVLRYLLGHDDVRWYNGSWTDWAERKDLPAATGEK